MKDNSVLTGDSILPACCHDSSGCNCCAGLLALLSGCT